MFVKPVQLRFKDENVLMQWLYLQPEITRENWKTTNQLSLFCVNSLILYLIRSQIMNDVSFMFIINSD